MSAYQYFYEIAHRKLTQLFAVGGVDTTTINDSRRRSNSRRNCFGEVRPNVCVCLLGLGRCGYLARSDCPHRLIRNDNLAEDNSNNKQQVMTGCKSPYLQSDSLSTSTTALSCSWHTSTVLPDSRCSSVSPMHRMTLSFVSRAVRVFCATI